MTAPRRLLTGLEALARAAARGGVSVVCGAPPAFPLLAAAARAGVRVRPARDDRAALEDAGREGPIALAAVAASALELGEVPAGVVVVALGRADARAPGSGEAGPRGPAEVAACLARALARAREAGCAVLPLPWDVAHGAAAMPEDEEPAPGGPSPIDGAATDAARPSPWGAGPPRAPEACAGCPQRGPALALRELDLEPVLGAPCALLGAFAPLGAANRGEAPPAPGALERRVAVLGAGALARPEAAAAAARDAGLVLVVEDGWPFAPAGGRAALLAAGGARVREVDAHDPRALAAALREERLASAPALLVARGACPPAPGPGRAVDAGRCNRCGACLRTGCPAIFEREGELEAAMAIAPERCAGCGLCELACRAGAIRPGGPRPPGAELAEPPGPRPAGSGSAPASRALVAGVLGQPVDALARALAEAALAAGLDAALVPEPPPPGGEGSRCLHLGLGAHAASPHAGPGELDLVLALDAIEALRWAARLSPRGRVVSAETARPGWRARAGLETLPDAAARLRALPAPALLVAGPPESPRVVLALLQAAGEALGLPAVAAHDVYRTSAPARTSLPSAPSSDPQR